MGAKLRWCAAAGIPGSQVAVLAAGNRMRGDDAFGPEVAARLSGEFPERVFDGGQAPENELPRVARLDPRLVVFVDAVDFGGEGGDLAVLDPEGLRSGGFDTHTASLSLSAEFLREASGARVALLAVQPVSLELEAPLSAAVEAAVEAAADALRELLGGPGGAGG